MKFGRHRYETATLGKLEHDSVFGWRHRLFGLDGMVAGF
jgi:hypothetical protein